MDLTVRVYYQVVYGCQFECDGLGISLERQTVTSISDEKLSNSKKNIKKIKRRASLPFIIYTQRIIFQQYK